jgi:hypothetical protein
MNIRIALAIPGLLALAAAPMTAQAYGSDTAANACVQAFVDTYLPKDRTVKLRRLSPVAGPLGNYTKRFTIDLSARLSRSGNEIVSARCVASADGRVLEMASLPVTRGEAELAAK